MANKRITELTSVTIPLDGTEEIAIVQSSVTKKGIIDNIKTFLKTYFDTIYQAILVSGTNIKTINGTTILGSGDLVISGGGGGKCVFFKSLLTAGTTVTTNGVNTYVDSIFIPAETIQAGDIVELRYSCAKSAGASTVLPRAWLSNTLGALTEIFATGFVTTTSNAKILVKRSYIIETNTRTFCVNRNQDGLNSDEDPSAGTRAFIDMGVSFANNLYLDFSILNNATGNIARIDFAYIKVYRE